MAPRFFEGKNERQLAMPVTLHAPMACALSSTTGTVTAGRVAGRPKRCTGMSARVFGPQAAAAARASRLKVSGSMSAKIGRAWRRAMHPTVA